MTDFAYGPVDILLVGFGNAKPHQNLLTALIDTLQTDAVRLIDLVLVSRSEDGSLEVEEIEDVSEVYGLGTVELEASGIASAEDLDALAAQLPAGHSAAVVVLEHTWARRLASALASEEGEVLASERVPAAAVNDLLTQIRS